MAEDDEDSKFELVVWAVKPVKAITAARLKREKVAKAEPITFGPADLNTGVDWESFLEILADLLKTKLVLLVIHSFEWKWLKPANSPWLLLQTPSAYESLMHQLHVLLKNMSGSYIIIRMEQPVQQPVDRTKVCSHWSHTSLVYAYDVFEPWSSSSQAQNTQNVFGLDDDNDKDDKKQKKVFQFRFSAT
jgi:hypothetical protein